MIERFKGITATLEEWNSASKTLPDEVWAIVVVSGTVKEPTKVGIKIGNGSAFSDTPWVIDPRVLDQKLQKPVSGQNSESKFLNQAGEYVEIEQGADLDSLLQQLSDSNLQVTTKEQVEWIAQQMYVAPKFSNFRTSSSLIGPVEMGSVVQGDITLLWNTSGAENIATANLAVSEGSWENIGSIASPKTTSSQTIKGNSSITSTSIKEVIYTLSGTDVKGNPIPSKQLKSVFTHRIYYGTCNNRVIADINEITGRASKLSNSRKHTLNFTPSGSQYSIIMIPTEIGQENISIVNANVSNIPHSYNMNEGDGGTIAKYTLTHNGINYNVYVSYGKTSGQSTAIIN